MGIFKLYGSKFAYKIPRHFIVTDILPRNASGKVLKYHLREQWRDARSLNEAN